MNRFDLSSSRLFWTLGAALAVSGAWLIPSYAQPVEQKKARDYLLTYCQADQHQLEISQCAINIH